MTMHNRGWAMLMLCATALILTGGCATLDGGPTATPRRPIGSGFSLLSTEQEIQLGEEFAQQVEEQEAILDDPEIQAYVAEIGQRLARVAPRQDVTYSFKVIDAPDTVNAFALPGGFMYLYTGLMKLCENEAELAAVMAHEIGHVAARHHGEMMTRQVGMSLITSMILGEDPNAVAQTVTRLFAAGLSARFSRTQEREADELGMEILFRAGYRPDAMISFMNKLLDYDRQREGMRPPPIFATHPHPQERVDLLQALVQRYPADMRQQNVLNTDRYHSTVLSRLR